MILHIQGPPMINNILIAEDDPDAQFILNYAFIEDGLAVKLDFVSDGSELFSFLKDLEHPLRADSGAYPNLILLDIHMPYVGGKDVLVELKSHARYMHIPVATLTSHYAEEEKIFYKDMGVVRCYTKPRFLEEYILLIKDNKRNFLQPRLLATLPARDIF